MAGDPERRVLPKLVCKAECKSGGKGNRLLIPPRSLRVLATNNSPSSQALVCATTHTKVGAQRSLYLDISIVKRQAK